MTEQNQNYTTFPIKPEIFVQNKKHMSEWKETDFGKIPIEWDYEPLEKFFHLITYGFTNPMPTSNEGFYMLTAKDINDGKIQYDTARKTSEEAYFKFLTIKSKPKINDILITKDGSIGRVAICDRDDICISQSVALIRPNDRINPLFLKYLLEAPQYQKLIDIDATGSTIQHIYITKINKMLIGVPEINVQNRIIDCIHGIQNKIDLLHRQNQTLEKMAETLFRQWFVEEAKEDWEEGTLADLANFFNGKQRPNEVGTNPIYGGNGILGFTNTSNYKGKSIIIGRVGAYCGSLYYENNEIWVSDNALLVKAKNENQTHFLFYLLKTLDLNSMAEGSSHPLLTQTLLKSIQINIPAKEKIQLFDNQVEHIRNKTELNQIQIRTLSTLRDTLLPKLMSGEVRVEI